MRRPVITHYRENSDAFYAPCGLWLDAIDTTGKPWEVTCPRCLAKMSPIDNSET